TRVGAQILAGRTEVAVRQFNVNDSGKVVRWKVRKLSKVRALTTKTGHPVIITTGTRLAIKSIVAKRNFIRALHKSFAKMKAKVITQLKPLAKKQLGFVTALDL